MVGICLLSFVDKMWHLQVMSALDHPHIIHLEEVYEDDDRVCFILELAKVILQLSFFTAFLLRQLIKESFYPRTC